MFTVHDARSLASSWQEGVLPPKAARTPKAMPVRGSCGRSSGLLGHVAAPPLVLAAVCRAQESRSANRGPQGAPLGGRCQAGARFSCRLTHEYVLIFMPALPVRRARAVASPPECGLSPLSLPSAGRHPRQRLPLHPREVPFLVRAD